MARNLQSCYCSVEAAESEAARRTARDGKPRLVYANALGYWEPLTEQQIERREQRTKATQPQQENTTRAH